MHVFLRGEKKKEKEKRSLEFPSCYATERGRNNHPNERPPPRGGRSPSSSLSQITVRAVGLGGQRAQPLSRFKDGPSNYWKMRHISYFYQDEELYFLILKTLKKSYISCEQHKNCNCNLRATICLKLKVKIQKSYFPPARETCVEMNRNIYFYPAVGGHSVLRVFGQTP